MGNNLMTGGHNAGGSDGGQLTDEGDWDESWADVAITSVRFDPGIPIYRDFHKIVNSVIPKQGGCRFLEIGAYPGYLMWYFSEYFDCKVTGIEFVPWCCTHAEQLLRKEGVKADLIETDVFDYEPDSESDLWDIVASSGFIEHFDDAVPIINKHISLAKPGGYIVIAVPNHSSVYGWLMKKLRPDRWRLHNLMTLDDALAAFSAAGGVDIVFHGYTGRFGFWASCLYETAKNWGRLPYFLIRAPLWLGEHVAQWCVPNSRIFSPAFLVIARRR